MPYKDSFSTKCTSANYVTRCAERAARAVRQATAAGVLNFLDQSLLRALPFADDFPAQRELYSAALHQLVMEFLDAEPGRQGAHHIW